MKVLLLDTSSSKLIVAICNDEKIIYEKISDSDNNHSKLTMTLIEKAFKENNLEPKDINKIMVAVGPGSYTGIRIGVTIAKTYAWALGIDLIPISSLDLMREGIELSNVIPVIDARRNNYFTKFDNKEMFIDLDTLKEKLHEDVTITGEESLKENFKEFSFCPLNYNLLKTITKHLNDNPVNPHNLKPNYLKLTEAEEKM